MSIRSKIVLVFIPLLIAPLLLTAMASTLSARNGITAVATSFLRFKGEEMVNYATGQWTLLVENRLAGNSDYVDVAKEAVGGFARNLIRSETELILAVDGAGRIEMSTEETTLDADEQAEIGSLAAAGKEGWYSLDIGGVARVIQTVKFEPFGWYIIVSESRDTFYRSINQILTQTAIILAVTLAAALVLLLYFAYYLAQPLRDVADAMEDIIRTGELTRRVDVLYKDETGRLGHTFNLMTRELGRLYVELKKQALNAVVARIKEHKTRTIFQKYVPSDVIDQFFANPEGMLIGEDRTLVVLFSDVRSFTSISEKMAPYEVVESLNKYFGTMVDIILKYGGMVDKYIGDAIMAIFGAPVKHQDEAERSVNSALEMVEALEDFNLWQQKQARPPWRIGIGINYGFVTIGNIGSEKKMDYTVIGDKVNEASRLEGLTKTYGVPIIVSDSIERYVKDQVRCRQLAKVVVKGRSEPSGIYQPMRDLTPDMKTMWDLHDEAVRLFYDKSFQKAAARFREIQRMAPDDRPSQIYLAMAEQFSSGPLPDNWQAQTMTEK